MRKISRLRQDFKTTCTAVVVPTKYNKARYELKKYCNATIIFELVPCFVVSCNRLRTRSEDSEDVHAHVLLANVVLARIHHIPDHGT
jgi:hypothetical protein